MQADNETAYETFLREHPRSDFAPNAKSRIREIQAKAEAEQAKAEAEQAKADWGLANNAHTIFGYEQFLQRHPKSQQSTEASLRLRSLKVPHAWDDARGQDTIGAYEAFLREYSATMYASDAKARLSFLKGEAVVVLDSPSVMSWSNSKQVYSWEATFRETGGKAGFAVKTTDFYVVKKDGTKWSNNWHESVVVKPGGSARVDYWIGHWPGATFHCVWVGTDDKGIPIRIVQEVHIRDGL